MKNNKKGFTLIELLVVIAIIGLLSTLAVVALNSARQKSRDTKRLGDIKQLQTALEMFFNDYNQYPDGTTDAGTTDETMAAGTALKRSGVTYMAQIPVNPTDGLVYTYTPCEQTAGGWNCTAPLASPRVSYTLDYRLEGPSGGLVAGPHKATPAGISD